MMGLGVWLRGAAGALVCSALCSSIWARDASAFCGFFVSGADAALTNNASQVALLRKGNRTVLTMSNNYKGPPEDFAVRFSVRSPRTWESGEPRGNLFF
jgi:hypothetical protein